MIKKDLEKSIAINLRRKGLSYSEILKKIRVSKSTLSLWLRSVGLSKKQKHRLTKKKIESARRGALNKKLKRISISDSIKSKSLSEINGISNKNLFLIGVALYWAEGAKEKPWRPGSGIQFGNSDPRMIKLFLKWLVEICKIDRDMIVFTLYLHENFKDRVDEYRNYWISLVGFPNMNFNVYFKKSSNKSSRVYRPEFYKGLMRISVKRSSSLVRRLEGWVDGICRFI